MRRRSLFLAFALIVPSLAVAACGDDDVRPVTATPDAAPHAAPPDAAPSPDAGPITPKGARVLGLAMRVDDVLFAENAAAAVDAGARVVDVTLAWDEIERATDAGADDAGTQLFHPSLHVANLVLDQDGMQALVAVPALDAYGSRAPADLAARPIDDAELGARYDALTDYVLGSFPDAVVNALLVGTDVDVALGDDAAKHAAFATFVGRAAAKVHAKKPKVKVGFTVTSEGLQAKASRFAAAWAASDVVGVTVLPVNAAAHVRAPGDVAGELDRIVSAAPAGKPIVIHEAGFPSSATCGSDEAKQAMFVSALFTGWDRHADRIPVVAFREILDADDDLVNARAARAGRSDAPFLALLGSLGLQAGDARKKQGWAAFLREARARGF